MDIARAAITLIANEATPWAPNDLQPTGTTRALVALHKGELQMTNRIPSNVLVAVLAIWAPAAFAQLAPVGAGTPNTLVVPQRTVASRNLASSEAPVAEPKTNTPGVSNLTTRGSLTGDVTQTQTSVSANEQTLSVAGADTASRGNNLRLQGDVSAPIQQIVTGAGDTPQAIDVGSLTGAASVVGTATTQGSISGAGVTQSSSGTGRGAGGQTVGVANIQNSQATSINTRGTITGAITQIQTSTRGSQQSLTAGTVSDLRSAGQVSTNGTVNAAVSQTTTSGLSQQIIDVGSVKGGNPAEVRTDAVLTGTVTQDAAGSNGAQIIQIGSVEDSRGNVATRAASSGVITQTQNGVSSAQQTISVGSAKDSSTQSITEAFTTGDITQSASNGGQITQNISVGSSENSSAVVTTRALVTGNVTQSGGGSLSTQTINLGSVRGGGSGNITTDVQVSGDISQSANGSGQLQRVIVGGVEARR